MVYWFRIEKIKTLLSEPKEKSRFAVRVDGRTFDKARHLNRQKGVSSVCLFICFVFSWASYILIILLRGKCWHSRSEWGLWFCISIKFLGDAAAAILDLSLGGLTLGRRTGRWWDWVRSHLDCREGRRKLRRPVLKVSSSQWSLSTRKEGRVLELVNTRRFEKSGWLSEHGSFTPLATYLALCISSIWWFLSYVLSY